MNAGVIEQSASTPRLRGQPSAAKSWLKAIELTSRIEAEPSRLFSDTVEDWARRQGDRVCLASDDGDVELSGARGADQPLCALGAVGGH